MDEVANQANNRAGTELASNATPHLNNLAEPYRALVVSDPHGAEHFWQFIQYGILSTGKQGVCSPRHPSLDYAGVSDLFILGDILDRAKDPIGTFQIIQALMQDGRTHYVTGNHDLYAFMNIMGLHLPYYDGYKGIEDDFAVPVNDGFFAPKQWLEAELSQTGPEQGIRSKSHWAQAFADYVGYAADRQKAKWNEYYEAISNDFGVAFETPLDIEKGSDALNFPDKRDCSEAIKNDAALRHWWAEILGHNVGTIVFTGLKAVDKMSINWWLDKQQELQELRKKYPQQEALWQQMSELLGDIVSEYRAKLNEEYGRGNFEWLVIDAIMYRHYESTEWNAFDWVFHKGWGSLGDGFLAKRNEVLEQEGKDPLTYANYLDDPLVNELGEFYLKSFNTFERDGFGNYLTHSMLPFDEEGDLSIGYVNEKGRLVCEQDGKRVKGLFYKGRQYQNNAVFEGLRSIADDVSTFDPQNQSPADILEALTLITSIYADETTIVKPAIIAKTLRIIGAEHTSQSPNTPGDAQLIQIGTDYALNKAEVPALFCGHNPYNKLADQGIARVVTSIEGKPLLIHTDGGMAPKFGEKGIIITVSNDTEPEMILAEYDKTSKELIEIERISIESWMVK
ncbi:MAG: metallophosphoesterase [Coriobacteriales bacterium]|jgi:hypothetical protein|nr:metallophosphoesterase [Coriobacteriales bacterium]